MSSSRTRVTPTNPVLNKPVKFAVAGTVNILFGTEMNSIGHPVSNGIQCTAQGLCESMMTNKQGLVELHRGVLHVAMILAQKISETEREQPEAPPMVKQANLSELPNLHVIPGGA